MLSSNKPPKRRKPASSQKSYEPEKPEHFIFVYASDRAVAGFAFVRFEGITRPVANFTLDSQQPKGLETALDKINADFPIERIFVPPTREGDDFKNVLLVHLPKKYTKQAATELLNFTDCANHRSIALESGALIEEGYEQADKLRAAIRLASEGREPDAWLMSYLCGVATVSQYRAVQASDYWTPSSESDTPKY